jgi:hypothetical protein
MTYRDALKHAARSIPLAMIDRGVWHDLVKAVDELMAAVATIAVRVVSLALFPLSALLLAALVRAHERRRDRLRQEWRRAMKESDSLNQP